MEPEQPTDVEATAPSGVPAPPRPAAATGDVRAPSGPDLPVPDGFVRDVLERVWEVPHTPARVWSWLSDPATFTDSQVPPWRVEFLDPATGAPDGFRPGVLTTHHGPLLSLPGVLGAVDPPRYRDLRYLYGAHAVSMRAFRPVRLEFHLDDHPPSGCLLRLTVTADVRAPLLGLWRFGNNVFWSRFGAWARRGVREAG